MNVSFRFFGIILGTSAAVLATSVFGSDLPSDGPDTSGEARAIGSFRPFQPNGNFSARPSGGNFVQGNPVNSSAKPNFSADGIRAGQAFADNGAVMSHRLPKNFAVSKSFAGKPGTPGSNSGIKSANPSPKFPNNKGVAFLKPKGFRDGMGSGDGRNFDRTQRDKDSSADSYCHDGSCDYQPRPAYRGPAIRPAKAAADADENAFDAAVSGPTGPAMADSGPADNGPADNGPADEPTARGGATRIVRIMNPAKNRATLKFAIAGRNLQLRAGQAVALPIEAGAVIDFDRGDDGKVGRYTLSPGEYTFASTNAGWELFRGKVKSRSPIHAHQERSPVPGDNDAPPSRTAPVPDAESAASL